MSNRVKNMDSLDARLLALKLKEANQQDDIRVMVQDIKESVSPANLVKKAVHMFSPGDLSSSSLMNVAAGVAAGFVAKKIYKGRSAGLIKKLTAPMLQYIITVVVKNTVARRRKTAEWQQ